MALMKTYLAPAVAAAALLALALPHTAVAKGVSINWNDTGNTYTPGIDIKDNSSKGKNTDVIHPSDDPKSDDVIYGPGGKEITPIKPGKVGKSRGGIVIRR